MFFVLSSLMLTWTYTRLSTGFGGFGGTVDVSRYSVWLIFLFFPILWQVLSSLAKFWGEYGDCRERPPWRSVKRTNARASTERHGGRSLQLPRLVQSLAAITGLALIGFSAWLYRPWHDENSRRPTPVSNWLYANLSGCYDPLPRIFYSSRGGQREQYGDDESFCSDWAVSDASGNKILVWREAFQRQSAEAPAVVVGRGCLDPQAVYAIAEEYFARHPATEFTYINRRGQELFRPPPLPLGRKARLGKQGDSGRFLAAGWYPPEADGTWSNGDRAELIFSPTGVEPRQTYAIQLHIANVVGAGIRPQKIEPTLNGAPLLRNHRTPGAGNSPMARTR